MGEESEGYRVWQRRERERDFGKDRGGGRGIVVVEERERDVEKKLRRVVVEEKERRKGDFCWGADERERVAVGVMARRREVVVAGRGEASIR